MRRIRVVIRSVEEDAADEMTERACGDLPTTDVTALQFETARNDLETTTHATGSAILRGVVQAQWDAIDARLTEQHRQPFPADQSTADGYEPTTVASHFGAVHLKRQVCYHADTYTHLMPGNGVLPAVAATRLIRSAINEAERGDIITPLTL